MICESLIVFKPCHTTLTEVAGRFGALSLTVWSDKNRCLSVKVNVVAGPPLICGGLGAVLINAFASSSSELPAEPRLVVRCLSPKRFSRRCSRRKSLVVAPDLGVLEPARLDQEGHRTLHFMTWDIIIRWQLLVSPSGHANRYFKRARQSQKLDRPHNEADPLLVSLDFQFAGFMRRRPSGPVGAACPREQGHA